MKKLIAGLLTALMALAPLVAAVDLGDYPDFLTENGVLDVYVVVGADAKPADVVGAVDLAARLAAESYELVSTSGGLVVAGGKTDDVNIGEAVTAEMKSSLDDDDLAGLQDTTVTFNSETYNVHDEVVLGSTGLKVMNSINSSDDDYEENLYLEVARNDIAYFYVFDETVNLTGVSSDTPLEIDFLGTNLEIISVSGAGTLSAQVGTELSLGAGESATVNGKTITLERTSASAALVTVDGVTQSISSGATRTVNGLEVKVDTLFDDDGIENDFAILVVGSDAVKSYDDGDPYIGEDEDDPDWVWVLSELTTSNSKGDTVSGGGPTIGVSNKFAKDGLNEDPVAVGESYVLPGGFIEVSLDSLTVPEDNYVTLDLEFENNIDLDDADDDGRSWGTSEVGLILTADVEESLVLDYDATGWSHQSGNFTADIGTDTIYVTLNSSGHAEIFYVDDDNHEVYAGDVPLDATKNDWGYVDYKETTGADDVQFAFTGNATVGSMVFHVQEELAASLMGVAGYDLDINITVDSNGPQYLGATDDDADADELRYTDGLALVRLGTKDENHRTYYGIVVVDPEGEGTSDQVQLLVPGDVVEARVVVSSTGTSSTGSTGGRLKKVVPVSTAVARLDTEVSDPATAGKDLVLVGGPAVNRLTAQAMGYSYPTYGSSLTEFAENEAYIEYKPGVFTSGQDVVVVAGWEAENTRDATSVLQKVDSFLAELDGNMAVKVTDVSSSGITPA